MDELERAELTDAPRRPGIGDAVRRAAEMRRGYRRWPVAWLDRLGLLPTRPVRYEVDDPSDAGGGHGVLYAETNGQDVRAINEIWLGDLYLRHLPDEVRLAPDLCVVDLGANKGFFATWIATVLDVGHLLCLEADDDNANVLERNLEANGLLDRTDVVRGAVVPGAEVPRTITFYRATSPLLHTVVPPEQAELHGVDDGRYVGESHEVPAVSLGDVVQRAAGHGGRVHLLKIDVEGVELDLLRVAPAEVLLRVDHLVAETSHRGDAEVEGRLRDLGFEVETEPCFLYATRPSASS